MDSIREGLGVSCTAPHCVLHNKLTHEPFCSARQWEKCIKQTEKCLPHARYDLTAQHTMTKQGRLWRFPAQPPKEEEKKLQQEMADLTETSSKTINPCSSPHGSMSAICATSQSFAVTLGCQSSSLCRFLCTHGFLGFGGGREGRVRKCHVIRAPLQSSSLQFGMLKKKQSRF